MSRALLPLHVEVVDGEVLPPLLAPCVSNLVNLFTPDADKRIMVAPDRELLHPEELVAALLNHVLYCQSLELYNGVGFIGWVEAAGPACH
jgi:hypothetical protein